jgi:hypothetical protein
VPIAQADPMSIEWPVVIRQAAEKCKHISYPWHIATLAQREEATSSPIAAGCAAQGMQPLRHGHRLAVPHRSEGRSGLHSLVCAAPQGMSTSAALAPHPE